MATESGQSDSRELLLFWINADDGDTWLHDAVDLGHSDTEYLNECRKEALDRASEYRGRVGEQRVRVPDVGYLFPTLPPPVDAEVVR